MKPTRYSHWNTSNVGHVKLSVRPPPRKPYTILRVDSIIDTGRGKTLVLKNALPDFLEIDLVAPSGKPQKTKLPSHVAGLNCTYIGRGFGVVTEISSSLQLVARRAKLATVVPDVARPGDFMIYRHDKGGMKFAGVIRAMTGKAAALCQEQRI